MGRSSNGTAADGGSDRERPDQHGASSCRCTLVDYTVITAAAAALCPIRTVNQRIAARRRPSVRGRRSSGRGRRSGQRRVRSRWAHRAATLCASTLAAHFVHALVRSLRQRMDRRARRCASAGPHRPRTEPGNSGRSECSSAAQQHSHAPSAQRNESTDHGVTTGAKGRTLCGSVPVSFFFPIF